MLEFKTIAYADGKKVGQVELPGYFIDYYRGGDRLVVTFEGAGGKMVRPDPSRKPWAFDFLEKTGYSVLGVKPKRVDWYRGADLHAVFRSGELRALAGQHTHIFLYGGSMGGYAALAFAETFPGCTSIALNPQTTLKPDLVPWDKRYPISQKQDWSGDFCDGRNGAAAAEKVYIIYDPFYKLDRMHVERLHQENLVKLRIPLIGHSVPIWMNKMGILKQTIEGILSGGLQERDFRKMAEARKLLPRYYTQIAERKPGSCLAKACLEKALSLDPVDQDALTVACKALLAEKRYHKVLSMSEKLRGAGRYEYRARAYLLLGRVKKADAVLSRALIWKNMPVQRLAMIEKIARELGRGEVAARIAEERKKRMQGNGPA